MNLLYASIILSTIAFHFSRCFEYLSDLDEGQKEHLEQLNFFELREDQFDRLVAGQEKPWFVFFYASWCMHCKKVAPNWKLFAGEVEEEFRDFTYLATVDW